MHIDFFKRLSSCFFVMFAALCLSVHADNQTEEVSPILFGEMLPFDVQIETVLEKEGSAFTLPNGLQSYLFATHKGKWLLLGGRTNGLHGFNDDPNNFPPRFQNRVIYVVDVEKKQVFSRSLLDEGSGLTLDQIDSLSVTSAQSYQSGKTLYITGGYGFRNSVNQYVTFDCLTAVDVPSLIDWVLHPEKKQKASHAIRQITDPTFQVTGGAMFQLLDEGPTLLVFGQNFEGPYQEGAGVQVYTKEVRKFRIIDQGGKLGAKIYPPSTQEESFRRRDLNVVPIITKKTEKKTRYALAALSGVFTMSGGIWTVPVTISPKGKPFMADPAVPFSFKQSLNNYTSPFLSLYSQESKEMYTVIFGGLTYQYFADGSMQTDEEIPFTNQVATIKRDKRGLFFQYLMSAQYPPIYSTQSNPGNRLLFGASASFIPAAGQSSLQYAQFIYKLDQIKEPTVIGYIVGGIQSTMMNTNTMLDSAASPYIFQVVLTPKK